MKASPSSGGTRSPVGPLRLTGPVWYIGIAALTATALVAYWSRHDLPISLRLRPAPVPTAGAPLQPAQERLFGPPLRRIGLDDQTPDFEPEAYAMYYADVGANRTDEALSEHYLTVGRPANRIFQRLRVVLSYEPGAGFAGPMAATFGGLCNQLYTHVGMLALALQSGSDVVLPTAMHRGGRQFQDNFDKSEIQPLRAPLDTLLDVDHLMAWAAASDATFHRAEPDPDNSSLALEIEGGAVCCMAPLDSMVDIIRAAVLGAAEGYVRDHPDRPLPVVRLTLRPPQLLFALGTMKGHTDLVEDISRNLRPAQRIQTLVDVIVAKMSAKWGFNGLHLRAEEDARMWDQYGSAEEFWGAYLAAMESAGFNGSAPLYVASGLLTYMNATEWDSTVVARLMDRGLCSEVVTKESILTSAQTDGLLSEALALVDLLVLVRADRFTGFGSSTMSWVVQEYRCLAGTPPSTSSYPEPTRSWLPDLWANAGLLSDHAATCPESS